jgi:hypothetical protein
MKNSQSTIINLNDANQYCIIINTSNKIIKGVRISTYVFAWVLTFGLLSEWVSKYWITSYTSASGVHVTKTIWRLHGAKCFFSLASINLHNKFQQDAILYIGHNLADTSFTLIASQSKSMGSLL